MRRRAGQDPGPLGLLVVLASFALTGYAGLRLFQDEAIRVLLWFAGSAVVHDMVLLPVYSLADRAAQGALRIAPGAPGRPAHWINHLRVPVLLSGLLLLIFFPLVLGLVGHYQAYSDLREEVFWEHWLLLTSAFFAVSAALLAARTVRDRPGIRAKRRGRVR